MHSDEFALFSIRKLLSFSLCLTLLTRRPANGYLTLITLHHFDLLTVSAPTNSFFAIMHDRLLSLSPFAMSSHAAAINSRIAFAHCSDSVETINIRSGVQMLEQRHKVRLMMAVAAVVEEARER